MRGKYSPTVLSAYSNDQDWFINFCNTDNNEYSQYDPDGFNSYGYNKDGVDRAGIHENDYAYNDGTWHYDYNNAYDNAIYNWDFDGVKPVRRV